MVDKDIVQRLNQIHSMNCAPIPKIDYKCNRKCSLGGDSICKSCGRHLDDIVKSKSIP